MLGTENSHMNPAWSVDKSKCLVGFSKWEEWLDWGREIISLPTEYSCPLVREKKSHWSSVIKRKWDGSLGYFKVWCGAIADWDSIAKTAVSHSNLALPSPL